MKTQHHIQRIGHNAVHKTDQSHSIFESEPLAKYETLIFKHKANVMTDHFPHMSTISRKM